MAVGGFFFNGQLHWQPQVDVQVNIQSQAGVLNGAYSLVLLGSANDSKPQAVNEWFDIPSALAALSGGRLFTGVQLASDPLANIQVAPASIKTVRVDEATQATLAIDNSTVPQLDLTSTSWGLNGNQTAVAISAGSVSGYMVQARNDAVAKSVSQDNISRQGLSLSYNGATVSVTVTTNGTSLTVNGGTTPALMFSVPYSTYTTIQQVVNQINSQANFTAAVLTSNPNDPSTALDWVTNAAVSTTAIDLNENLYAVNLWFNSGAQPWVTSVIPSGAGAGLPTTGTWTYLTGATVTAPTTTDWQNGMNALESDTDLDVVVVLTGQSAVHTMLAAHCASMWAASMPRWGHAGGDAGELYTQEITRAQGLNSPYVELNWPGVYSSVPTAVSTLYPPYYTAVMTGSARAAQAVPANTEGQSLNVVGMETPTSSVLDALLQYGVAALKQDKSNGVYVSNAIMTIQNPQSEISRQEVSSIILGAYVRDVKTTIQAQINGITTQILANLAAKIAYNIAEDYFKAGLFTAQPSANQFSGAVSTSNAVTVAASVSVGVPNNFVGVSINATTL